MSVLDYGDIHHTIYSQNSKCHHPFCPAISSSPHHCTLCSLERPRNLQAQRHHFNMAHLFVRCSVHWYLQQPLQSLVSVKESRLNLRGLSFLLLLSIKKILQSLIATFLSFSCLWFLSSPLLYFYCIALCWSVFKCLFCSFICTVNENQQDNIVIIIHIIRNNDKQTGKNVTISNNRSTYSLSQRKTFT